jgi:hypothetical protein
VPREISASHGQVDQFPEWSKELNMCNVILAAARQTQTVAILQTT